MDDFFVDGRGSSEFGARLLASYTVGGASLERTRVRPAAGMRFVPAGSRVGLKQLSLPVHVFGQNPLDAQQKKSALNRPFRAPQGAGTPPRPRRQIRPGMYCDIPGRASADTGGAPALTRSSSIQTILSAPEFHRILPFGSRAVPPVGNRTPP